MAVVITSYSIHYTKLYDVVTAHYDHLGVRNGQVFNGADDNASGVAALLAVAGSNVRQVCLCPGTHVFEP